MLKSLLAFAGLTASAPAAPPAKPPSPRSDIPVGRRPTLRPTVREPEPTPEELAASVARQAARDARNAAVSAEQQSAAQDVRFAQAVRLILRAYDRSTARYFDPRDVAMAEANIGEVVAEYMRACRYAGVRLPPVGEAMSAARLAAYRSTLTSRAMCDLDTWEKGDIAVAKARCEAKSYGEPVPPTLVMPAEVVAEIARIAQQRLERLAKRAGGKAGTGTETVTISTTDSSVATTSGTTGTEASTEEPETYTPPGLK